MNILIIALSLFFIPAADGSPETQYGILEDYFEEEDIDLICRVIESETSICPMEAKENVASVILNRYFGGWGGDKGIKGVCRKGQFSLRREDYSEASYMALLNVWQCGLSNDAYYFKRERSEAFCGGTWAFYDGYHNFYLRH